MGRRCARVGVTRLRKHLDVIPASPAKQFIHGNIQRLVLDIPRRDIDARNCRADETVARIKAASKHSLPEILDSPRVFADKPLLQVLDDALDRLPTPLESGFAHTGDPGVRMNKHRHQRATWRLNGDAFDIGDFHRFV